MNDQFYPILNRKRYYTTILIKRTHPNPSEEGNSNALANNLWFEFKT